MTAMCPAPRVAALLRGVDGLFLDGGGDAIVSLALVPRGSAEEAWARSFLPAEQVLPFTLAEGAGPLPSTEQVLLRSDVDAVCRAAGVAGLLLSAACSPAIHAWAGRRGLRLFMSDFAHQRALEDKITFDALLRERGLPTPPGGAILLSPRPHLPVRGRAVVQIPDSLGGEGTFFVRGRRGAARLVAAGAIPARGAQRVLVRRHVTGRPCGLTVFVVPGLVALSAVRLQCYHPAAPGAPRRAFAGVQWLATASLPRALRRRLEETFLALGTLLHRRRFLGFANCDFLIDEQDRPQVLECNPRMSAATPQLLRDPALLGGLPAGPRFIEACLGPGPGERTWAWGRSPRLQGLPDVAYRGATLDIVPTGPLVTRAFPSGRYALASDAGPGDVRFLGPEVRGALGAGEFALFSFARPFAQPGQPCHEDDTLATVLSDEPLYDERGALAAPARRILSHLRYTEAAPCPLL